MTRKGRKDICRQAMAEQEYFKNALSDFTYEAASGGAIRHLADLGYTVKQICEQLSFPTPYARVQKEVWQRLTDTGVILTEEPGSGADGKTGKAEYVVEHDKYGRTSFRLVASADRERTGQAVCWKERRFHESPGAENGRKLAAYLAERCSANDNEAYISCRIGLMLRRNPAEYGVRTAVLNERQREYLSGLPWEEKLCYHRLDKRMQEIAVRLYAAGKLEESCYFMKTGEKTIIDVIILDSLYCETKRGLKMGGRFKDV